MIFYNSMSNMETWSKIFVAGHRGMVWSAIVRKLESLWYTNTICKTHDELDLTNQIAVENFFATEKPEYIFLTAAKVWGIMANNIYPAEFLHENLMIQNNVIHNAWKHWVKKLLFLGSSCIYPKDCPQPIKEDYLLTGKLEPTNEPYAIAKIAGIKMCQSYNRQYGTNFIACMPTNLYGPWDNFDLQTSHVLPAMIRKFHDAKMSWADTVTLWGDGTPMREFLYVDDMADACLHLMKKFNPTKEQNEAGHIFMNIGTGEDMTIKELANVVKNIIWFVGDIVWDISKPNGTMRKVLDVSRLKKLWRKNNIGLADGIKKTYKEFKNMYLSS